jgi:hypothetical protein
MQAIKVLYGHELTDLVEEEFLFLTADLNDMGITDNLIVGSIIIIPSLIKRNLKKETIKPAAKEIRTRVLNGQAWVDLVLMLTGDEERLFEICDLNEMGITDEIIAGTIIKSIDSAFDKKGVVNALRFAIPASILNQPMNEEPSTEGIEFWAIEFDFMVN